MKLFERLDIWVAEKPHRGDWIALGMLTTLWALFFWRVLTPNPADQVSLPQGDFSGQFVSFGAYQARRLLAGQIPLWNPYNYAGSPFLADTQSAVFYLPRLVAISVSALLGGWSYSALQAEVIAHYWLVSVFMFLFVRAVTRSRTAGVTSAIAFTYGGYLTGYPPLQLAILEAAVWLPLCFLGIFKASEAGVAWRPRWLAMTAAGLGISLTAGHPQTSLFLTYAIIVYLIHRAALRKFPWKSSVSAVIGVCAAGYGLAAVQLLPGLEYTALSTRTNLTFDLRTTGFPYSDLITVLIPNVFSVWSPLYVGIPVLLLAIIAFQEREGSARFWGYFGLITLALSFGSSTMAFQLSYLALPGLALFRDQERAVYLVVFAAAVLAGLGIGTLQRGHARLGNIRRVGWIAFGIAALLAVNFAIAKLADPSPSLERLAQAGFYLAILMLLSLIVLASLGRTKKSTSRIAALIALIVFDLFSTNIRGNWEPVPVSGRQLLSDLVPVVQADTSLYRVDGRLGLGENYGTLIGMQDIQGTSPLRLKSLDAYMSLPNYRAYQLLAVKYVFTDWAQLEIPSTVRGETQLGQTKAQLHEITQPMPRTWMVYQVVTTADRAEALGWLADPAFDPARTVILASNPGITTNNKPVETWQSIVTSYAPEHIQIDVSTPQNGILVVSEMDYPGWQASVDGKSQVILDADAGLRALALAPGQHHISLDFRPLSFTVGAAISIIAMLGLLGVVLVAAGKSENAQENE